MFGKIVLPLIITGMLFVSCKKDEEKLSIKGVWNLKSIERYDSHGELFSKESLDTLFQLEININDTCVQEMMIDTAEDFYFVLYSSYQLQDSILTEHPHYLIDSKMDKYYWNPENNSFGNFPVEDTIGSYTITQPDNNVLITKIIYNKVYTIICTYNRLKSTSTDLLPEFQEFCTDLKSTENEKKIKKYGKDPLTQFYNKDYFLHCKLNN